jgi:hypothetical protein
MATKRALAGVAHDIAHHAASGLSYLSPHMAQALREAGLETTTLDLLDSSPYPNGVKEMKPLRLALQTLHKTSEDILKRYGFTKDDVTSIKLSATPAPWDKEGYLLHARAVVTAATGRTFDSGWLGEGVA